MRIIALVAAAALWVGCLKKSAFNCADDMACGTGGVCEPDTGFCSVTDGACASGRSYSDTAGNGLGGQCVGGGTPGDGPGPDPDATPVDAQRGCPDVNYVTIPDGTTGHRYKVALTDNWPNQDIACKASGGYLAIPNDTTEAAALDTFVSGNDVWVGVSDRATETSFRDVLNNAYAVTGITITGNKNNEDCALLTNAATLDIKNCNENHQAICECEE